MAENLKKSLIFLHNALVGFLCLLSVYYICYYTDIDMLQNALIWGTLTGITYKLSFDLKKFRLVVGAVYLTTSIFIFPWYYMPLIYIVTMLVYMFVKAVFPNFFTCTESEYMNIVVHTNGILVLIVCSFVKYLFFQDNIFDLKNDIFLMVLICILESAWELIFVYWNLKEHDVISSISKNAINAIRDSYGIYIIYFCLVLNMVILYQDYSYLGLGLASSYIFALSFAFSKEAKATQIEEDSYKDILTGVKNKKYYLEKLPDEFSTNVAIFFIDFNGFKGINDTYGHETGDAVIIHGAKILSKVVRGKDDIIRFGGDEFMLILYDADRALCKQIIARISALCDEMLYKNDDISIKIKMAIGVALCPEESQSKDELLTIADEKMYESKKHKLEHDITYMF